MPRNLFQRAVFAFLTVAVTVHAYVFYSLYVINGPLLLSLTGAHHVLEAIKTQGACICLAICCRYGRSS